MYWEYRYSKCLLDKNRNLSIGHIPGRRYSISPLFDPKVHVQPSLTLAYIYPRHLSVKRKIKQAEPENQLDRSQW
jgi:hypothetical protein